jgi:hypothetical protein
LWLDVLTTAAAAAAVPTTVAAAVRRDGGHRLGRFPCHSGSLINAGPA